MVFTAFDPAIDSPTLLVDAILDDDASLSIDSSSIEFVGESGQASLYDGTLEELGIDSGILLTSGTGTPPLENTSSSFGEVRANNGDEQLQNVADSAFDGAGNVKDANTLEFSFTVNNPDVNSVKFDLVFGSDEFPEFSNSSFVDVGAVFINGSNVALFNNNDDQPLSVIDNNLAAGNFIDNESDDLPIEYDGVSSPLTIFAPVQQGENTIKFGVADTGDQIYDSALFLANFTTNVTGGGQGVLLEKLGTDGNDTLEGTDINEFFDAGDGNDNINPGAGDDVVDAGPGNDTIVGGQGNNEIDGGEGFDTVMFNGNQEDFNIAAINDKTIQVGSNTDLLTNVETLSFNDADLSVDEILNPTSPEFILPQTSSPNILGGGSGQDIYILSPSVLNGTEIITISDTQGNNSIQLVAGLEIQSSIIAADALQLTLTNGAVINVNGADSFTYEPGGNAVAGIDEADIDFTPFVEDILGASVPTGNNTIGGDAAIITEAPSTTIASAAEEAIFSFQQNIVI